MRFKTNYVCVCVCVCVCIHYIITHLLLVMPPQKCVLQRTEATLSYIALFTMFNLNSSLVLSVCQGTLVRLCVCLCVAASACMCVFASMFTYIIHNPCQIIIVNIYLLIYLSVSLQCVHIYNDNVYFVPEFTILRTLF